MTITASTSFEMITNAGFRRHPTLVRLSDGNGMFCNSPDDGTNVEHVHHRNLSSKISKAERDDAVERLEVYRQWFSRVVMQSGKKNTIVILPIEEISAKYRDESPAYAYVCLVIWIRGLADCYAAIISILPVFQCCSYRRFREVQNWWSRVRPSTLLENLPNTNCEVGQAPYQSKVSKRVEYLPVAISLLASPGMSPSTTIYESHMRNRLN